MRLVLLAVLAALSACAVPPAAPPSPSPAGLALAGASFADLPGWPAEHPAAVLPALVAECRRLALLPAEAVLGGQGLAAAYGGRAGQWQTACRAARAVPPADDAAARAFVQAHFQPYRIETAALVTGYFEPEVAGSPVRTGAFQTPLLARPRDLVQQPPPASDPNGPPRIGRADAAGGPLAPYPSRAQIEAGAIDGAARPLFWLRDPADLFFLQVQGSGRIRLPDGAVVRLAYDGRNGRPYTPIGRVLVAEHALAPQDVSMASIRAWLAANPGRARAVMDANEDYVFFRIVANADSDLGPPGAMGLGLTPGRSAAIDRHVLPLGALLYLDAAPLQRLLLAQDLGTDIVGPARVDVFMGAGEAAGRVAGGMRLGGRVFVLLPRP